MLLQAPLQTDKVVLASFLGVYNEFGVFVLCNVS